MRQTSRSKVISPLRRSVGYPATDDAGTWTSRSDGGQRQRFCCTDCRRAFDEAARDISTTRSPVPVALSPILDVIKPARTF